MQIPVIIMAGGKGKRFKFDEINSECQEKLLLPLGNKTIIEHVIEAMLNSKSINRVIIAVSPSSKQTKSILEKLKKSIEIFDTPGAGFHLDIKYIMKKLNLKSTLIVSGDIPLIKPEFIDNIIEKFFNLNKPSLTVMADEKSFIEKNLTPTITFESSSDKKKLVPLGINIINGDYIEEPEIDQVQIISNETELLYNINTAKDYILLKSFFDKNQV